VRGEINRAIAPVHVTLLSLLFTLVGLLAAESKFQQPRGGPGATHVEGSGVVHRATRDSHAGTMSPHCSKGYPCPRVLTVGPGPASGEETSLQVGLKLDCRLARCFRALVVIITVSPPLVTPTATPVPAAD
jgi:hypothetical protein